MNGEKMNVNQKSKKKLKKIERNDEKVFQYNEEKMGGILIVGSFVLSAFLH
jgi:hypothetical protein